MTHSPFGFPRNLYTRALARCQTEAVFPVSVAQQLCGIAGHATLDKAEFPTGGRTCPARQSRPRRSRGERGGLPGIDEIGANGFADKGILPDPLTWRPRSSKLDITVWAGKE